MDVVRVDLHEGRAFHVPDDPQEPFPGLLRCGVVAEGLDPVLLHRVLGTDTAALVRTGPELAEAAKRCVAALGLDIQWDVVDAGTAAIEKYKTPLPEHVIESIAKNKIALKGPITTPVPGSSAPHIGRPARARHPDSPYCTVRVDVPHLSHTVEGLVNCRWHLTQ